MGNARINTLEKYVTIIIIRSMYFWNCDCIYFQFICAFRFIVKRGKFVKYESKCTYERKEKKNDLWRFFLPTRRFIWKYKAFKSNRTRMIFLFFFSFVLKTISPLRPISQLKKKEEGFTITLNILHLSKSFSRVKKKRKKKKGF